MYHKFNYWKWWTGNFPLQFKCIVEQTGNVQNQEKYQLRRSWFHNSLSWHNRSKEHWGEKYQKIDWLVDLTLSLSHQDINKFGIEWVVYSGSVNFKSSCPIRQYQNAGLFTSSLLVKTLVQLFARKYHIKQNLLIWRRMYFSWQKGGTKNSSLQKELNLNLNPTLPHFNTEVQRLSSDQGHNYYFVSEQVVYILLLDTKPSLSPQFTTYFDPMKFFTFWMLQCSSWIKLVSNLFHRELYLCFFFFF